MNGPSIRSPHDGFFKQTFGRVDFAREFLAKFLPDDVSACLDLASLEPSGDSYVDDQLRATQSDLVFTVRLATGGDAVVHLLFEHKSHADRLTAFQLLKYVVRINEQRLRDGLPLCCVVPLVVYHGPTGWNAARRVEQLIEVPPPLARFLPRFSIELFDLSGYGDEQLRGEAFLHATLLLLKYIMRPELPDELARIFALLSSLQDQARGLDCIKLLINYVVQGTDRVDADVLRGALEQGLPQTGDELMPTLAEQWLNQGKEQGRQQGLQEGRQEGRQEGAYIGTIQTCRLLLGEPAEPDDLWGKSTEELRELAQQLQTSVRQRLARP